MVQKRAYTYYVIVPLTTDIHCINTEKRTRNCWKGNIKLQQHEIEIYSNGNVDAEKTLKNSITYVGRII